MVYLHPIKFFSEQENTLYQESFPPEERRTLEMQHRVCESPDFQCAAIRLSTTQQFVGFITWWLWEALLYVEHFAIVPDQRCCGYGHKTLQQLSSFNRDIILEIDPVTTPLAARRLAFYQSCGFKLLPFTHTQKAYQHGYEDVPLLLMAKTINGTEFSAAQHASFEELFTRGPMQFRDATFQSAVLPKISSSV